MTELEAWHFLAEHRPGTGVGFVEFMDDGADKVMTAPILEDSVTVYCVARAPTWPECAIQLAEAIQCSTREQLSESGTAGESDSAISATDGGGSPTCESIPAASETEPTNADAATWPESEQLETSGERSVCRSSEES